MLEFVDAIVSGRLAPGSRLPRETALTEEHDVSRGVVRESMRALEERGLVTVKHGGHTVVNPREAWDLFDADVITVSLGGAGGGLAARRLPRVPPHDRDRERGTGGEQVLG